MTDSIQLKGFKEMNDQLLTLPNKVAGKALEPSVHAGAKVIRTEARRLAPKHADPYEDKARKDRKPGNLKRLIISRSNKKVKDGITVSIGPSRAAFYGRFIELGHAKVGGGTVAAIPFLRPALDAKGREAVQVMGDRLFVEIVKQIGKVNR